MPQWKISTEFNFSAAHYIPDYDGPCGRMHGHTYTVRLEARSSQLHPSQFCPHAVMLADFRTLRWAKQDALNGGLDHGVLNDLLPPDYATTAEMIAKFIYDRTKAKLPEGIQLKVAVSESPHSWAEYSDE